ncbi:MAG: acylphosphatase [Methanobacteriota archaeon]|nr:MAG: acylphosphatase [Euryarchaeota archaeon]
MNIRAHVYVSGRVQGVFYRAYTRDAARERGLSGWVRNLPDGRVEAVVEGEKEDVERLISLMKIGPPYARVEGIKIDFEEPTGEYRDFQIRY